MQNSLIYLFLCHNADIWLKMNFCKRVIYQNELSVFKYICEFKLTANKLNEVFEYA